MAYPNYYNGGYFPQYQNGAVPDMLNQYKGQYQQMPMQQPMVQQMPTPTNEMIWVLNENEATSYPVAPNNSVVLWDKNNPTIYVKSVNVQGVPSMRVLDFKERVDAPPQEQPKTHVCKCGDKFVSKADFEDLKTKFEELMAKYETLETKSTERSKTKPSKPKESEE